MKLPSRSFLVTVALLVSLGLPLISFISRWEPSTPNVESVNIKPGEGSVPLDEDALKAILFGSEASTTLNDSEAPTGALPVGDWLQGLPHAQAREEVPGSI